MKGANGSALLQVGDIVSEARDVVISFGETPALRGANVVKRGEVLAVIGTSGSGKSTLLYCLAGILVPDSGEVYLDGERLNALREQERSKLRRDRFGFIFQFGQLVPELTAEENVALPLLLGGMRRTEALRVARSWFERLELDGLERHRAGEMSGGQAQRVALARGLVAHPEVLFADEPTGSLDTLTGELVMGLMTGVAREEGTTLVLVTHEPRVAAYADREVIVRDGKVTSADGVFPVIRLGIRLTLGSGREAALRVLVTAAAVAIGVGLLLAALAGVNGLHAQTDRGAWLDTSAQASPSTSASDRLWWLSSTDQFGDEAIDRVDVAATGPSSPVPPGLVHLPGPGQYYASPALTTLLASMPANELRDRYPGHQVGIIGAAALPSPNSLIIVVGHTVRQLSRVPGAGEVGAIQRTPANCYACQNAVGSEPVLQFILAAGAVALLLPVLILIATASRLSAARREERFAAMRLVGATPRQVAVISAVEAVVAAVAGVAVGFALFFGFRPLLYHVPFTGAPLAQGDLSLHSVDIMLAVIGVPVAAVVSARLALRNVQTSPLGVNRRASSRPPRIVRVIPLLAGIAVLAYFDAVGKPGAIGGQLLELLVGFVLLVVGLVLAGPWFTTAGSRLMVKRASRPAALIAGRRLLDNPKAAFRFISGLVIALFVASALIGALSSIASAGSSGGGSAGRDTLADPFCSFSTTNCPASADVPSVSAQVLADLRSTPGVLSVTVLHESPSQAQQMKSFGVVGCDQLAKTPGIGKCAPGATVASLGYFLSNLLGHHSHASTTVWPSADLSVAEAARLPVDAVIVATDGSSGSIERARTALERAFPFQGTPVAVEALDPSTARLLAMIQDMTDVMIVASLIIAACSLAVNIVAGLGERKRPFSLLRLTGVPTALRHRVVALESALPLLLVAAVSIVVGLVSAALYLHSQVGIAFRIPGVAYWATVGGGLAASLAIIASTFPLLNRITGPEVARND